MITRLDHLKLTHMTLYELALMAADFHEPNTYQQAKIGPDASKWDQARQAELKILADQNVWDVVPTPANRDIIGSKWVYKIKRDTAGKISCYKARLVVQGFSQQPGTDFDKVFSPVVSYNSLCLLIATSTSYSWPKPDQLDIKGAFPYGYLNE